MRPGPSVLASRVAPVLGAVGAIFAGLLMTGGNLFGGFPVDDAWIHLVYGLSLRESGSLAYNEGIPASGATSTLWAFVAAAAHFVAGIEGPSWGAAGVLKAFGIAFHASTSAVAGLLAVDLSPPRWRHFGAFAAVILVSACPILAFGAASGMEVSLTATLLLAAFLAAGRGDAVGAGIVLALAALTRPECIVLLPATSLLLLASIRPLRRAVAHTSLAVSLPLVAFAGLSLRHYLATGRPMPATYYAKAQGFDPIGVLTSIDRAVRQVLFGMLPVAPLAIPAVALALVCALAAGVRMLRRARVDRRDRTAPLAPQGRRRVEPIVLTAAVGLGGLLYIAGAAAVTRFELPDWFYFKRYLVPAVPLLLVAMLGTTVHLARAVGVWLSFRRRATFGAARRLTLGGFASVSLTAIGFEAQSFARVQRSYAHDVDSINAVQVKNGLFVAEHVPREAVVWTVDAGAIRYFGRRRTFDIMALDRRDLLEENHGLLPREWWPGAVIIVPSVFQLHFADPTVLTVALETYLPDGSEPAPRQVVLFCNPLAPPGVRRRVGVSFHHQPPRVLGECLPFAPSSPGGS